MIDTVDVVVRLGAAVLLGGAVGLNRDLHHKSTGIRTLGLVALGSAMAVLAVADDAQADVSRVVQGVITGVGFIGAGVILHRPSDKKAHGLTTAAAIWVTAALGMLCGLAAWRVVAISAPLILAVLMIGGPLEKWCQRRLGSNSRSSSIETDQ